MKETRLILRGELERSEELAVRVAAGTPQLADKDTVSPAAQTNLERTSSPSQELGFPVCTITQGQRSCVITPHLRAPR